MLCVLCKFLLDVLCDIVVVGFDNEFWMEFVGLGIIVIE